MCVLLVINEPRSRQTEEPTDYSGELLKRCLSIISLSWPASRWTCNQQPKKIVTAVAKLGVKQNPPIFNTLPLLIKCIIISPFALIRLIRSPVGPLPAWDPIFQMVSHWLVLLTASEIRNVDNNKLNRICLGKQGKFQGKN